MRIHLDPTLCQGHLRCADLAPDYFTSDDLGYAELLHEGPVPDGDLRALDRCAANCPEGAISLDSAPDTAKEAR